MSVYKGIIGTIGNTPLVEIMNICTGRARVLAKCEFANPGGSVKDRIALYMINSAIENGYIKPDTTVIEPTSGNTGIGLALICAVKGIKLILTMPESMSVERRKLLAQLGADIILTKASLGMKGSVDKALELASKTPDSYVPQQFCNPSNPQAHYETTGPEIWEQTGGDIDLFVAAVGTGGTITGCARYLKQQKPQLVSIAVEPEKSPVLSGGNPGPHKIQGIGAGFVPEILDRSVIDSIITVSEEEAMQTSRLLACKEGLLVGISAGANMAVALRLASMREYSGKTIVTVLCDTGERYISTELFA
ncbi:MAG: cysteine synthase A [Phycisphaerae bacterium]|jgi:cysteine synthase A